MGSGFGHSPKVLLAFSFNDLKEDGMKEYLWSKSDSIWRLLRSV